MFFFWYEIFLLWFNVFLSISFPILCIFHIFFTFHYYFTHKLTCTTRWKLEDIWLPASFANFFRSGRFIFIVFYVFLSLFPFCTLSYFVLHKFYHFFYWIWKYCLGIELFSVFQVFFTMKNDKWLQNVQCRVTVRRIWRAWD